MGGAAPSYPRPGCWVLMGGGWGGGEGGRGAAFTDWSNLASNSQDGQLSRLSNQMRAQCRFHWSCSASAPRFTDSPQTGGRGAHQG